MRACNKSQTSERNANTIFTHSGHPLLLRYTCGCCHYNIAPAHHFMSCITSPCSHPALKQVKYVASETFVGIIHTKIPWVHTRMLVGHSIRSPTIQRSKHHVQHVQRDLHVLVGPCLLDALVHTACGSCCAHICS